MAGLVLTWDDVASSSIPEVIVVKPNRGAWGGNRSVNVDTPGRAGSWHFTEQRGMRDISADVIVVSDDIASRRATVTEVADWLDKLGRKKLIFSDQPDRYWYASLASDLSVDEWKRMSKFQIQFEAEPYAYGLTVSEDCTNTASTSYSDSTAVVTSAAVDPEIVITPTGGTLTSISFTLNDDTISWSGLVAAANSLTISSISSTVLLGQSGDLDLTGAYDPANLDMADVSGDFGVLVNGSNAWNFTATGTYTSLSICIKWRRRYR